MFVLASRYHDRCTEYEARIRELTQELAAAQAARAAAEAERSEVLKRLVDWLASRSGLGPVFGPATERPHTDAEPIGAVMTGRDAMVAAEEELEREILGVG